MPSYNTIKKLRDRPYSITIKLVMWPHYVIVCLVLCLQLSSPCSSTYSEDNGPPPVSILTHTHTGYTIIVQVCEAFHCQNIVCVYSLL